MRSVIRHCHFSVSGYYSKELSTINKLDGRKSVVGHKRVSSSYMSILCADNIFMRTYANSFRLTICTRYSWKIALNVVLDV
jgi:hypothetical protein